MKLTNRQNNFTSILLVASLAVPIWLLSAKFIHLNGHNMMSVGGGLLPLVVGALVLCTRPSLIFMAAIAIAVNYYLTKIGPDGLSTYDTAIGILLGLLMFKFKANPMQTFGIAALGAVVGTDLMHIPNTASHIMVVGGYGIGIDDGIYCEGALAAAITFVCNWISVIYKEHNEAKA